MAAGSSTATAVQASTGPGDRGRALFELATAYLLILTVIWLPRPWQARVYLVAAAFVAWATWRSWAGWHAMGWSRRNLLRSGWIIGAAAAVAVVAIGCAAHIGTLHVPSTPTQFMGRFIGYVIFACVQQFLLQDFFLLRFLAVGLTHRNAVVAAATIFAVAHLPSPILAVLTYVWGVVATAWFLRYRSLYALAVAHMILGVTLAICIPGPTIHNMRVGLSYLMYHAPHPDHLNH